MGLTERHWFENEDVPENYERALEDAVYNSRTNEKEDFMPRYNCISNVDKLIEELENYEPYARVLSNITVDGEILLASLDILRKQKEKEAKFVGHDGWLKWECPQCKNLLDMFCDGEQVNYCWYCGQKVIF